MAASDQLARQWGIVRVLHDRPDGVTAAHLARRFSVSKKTIVRDIESLIAAGFAVRLQQQKNRHTFHMAKGVRHLAGVQPTILELLALYAARTLLVPLAGTPIFGELMTLLHKLQGAAGPTFNGVLENLTTVFMVHPRAVKSYRQQQEIVDTLVDGVLRKKVCLIEYRALGRQKTRTHEIRPLKLFFHRGGLYLAALIGKHRYISTLAVERVVTASPMRKGFRKPRGLDLEKKYSSLFGVFEEGEPQRVEVLFSARVAPLILERVWHPEQVLEELPGGRVRWTCQVQGREEVLAWVMSRGPDAELVRPKAWREELVQRLEAARGNYQEP